MSWPMSWMVIGGMVAGGMILVLGVLAVLRIVYTRSARKLAEELLREHEERRRADLDAIVASVKANFGSLSLDALAKSSEEFLKLAKSRFDAERALSASELDQKKSLIDQQLHQMSTELEK